MGAPIPGSAGAGTYGYFVVELDPRLCPAPVCGGFQLRAANLALTHCADGSQQPVCYVASADFGALEAPPSFATEVVVRGRIDPDLYPGFGNLGKLVVESAWTAATSQAAQGSYFRLRDLGIVCATTPCFAFEARPLNDASTIALSSVDLGAVDATSDQLEAAQQAALQGDLLVAGATAPEPGPAGDGLALIASQFGLPEPHSQRCTFDEDCPVWATCNAAEICLPPPDCEPGEPCPAICTGYCVAAPTCFDLAGYDFGPCDAVLGWGIVGGVCTEVSGCEADPFTLFASREECAATCDESHAAPSMGLWGGLGLGLAVGVLGAASSQRRARREQAR